MLCGTLPPSWDLGPMWSGPFMVGDDLKLLGDGGGIPKSPNRKEEVGGSIPGSEISSLLDKYLALTCRPCVSKKKKEKKKGGPFTHTYWWDFTKPPNTWVTTIPKPPWKARNKTLAYYYYWSHGRLPITNGLHGLFVGWGLHIMTWRKGTSNANPKPKAKPKAERAKARQGATTSLPPSSPCSLTQQKRRKGRRRKPGGRRATQTQVLWIQATDSSFLSRTVATTHNLLHTNS